VIGRLARVGGVALDARFATRSPEPADLARASAWIAGNALAAGGVPVHHDRETPAEPSIIGVHADSLAELLAELATVPALLDVRNLPLRWRAALRGLGIPTLDGLAHDALVRGASVAVWTPSTRSRN